MPATQSGAKAAAPRKGWLSRAPAAAATPPATSSAGRKGPSRLVLGIALLLAVGVVGFFYNAADNEAKRIATDMRRAEDENRRLAAVKAKYDQEQKVKDNYERRVKVIDDLRANQAGPVNLLTMIGDTVNATDAVWLDSMQDAGGTVAGDRGQEA